MNSCVYEKKPVSRAVNLITRQIQSYSMKTYIGLFILVIVLVAASGCTTQQAKPAATATALTTTIAATAVPTVKITPLPTVAEVSKIITTPAGTASVTTVATPKPVMTPSTKITTIHIRNNAFVPDELTILPGTRITWINDDSVVHVVKATGDHKGMFTSGEIVSGGSTGYDFTQITGTYEFTDPSHPGMNGTIFVVEGDSIVGASPLISSSH
jgi:plastocyanin